MSRRPQFRDPGLDGAFPPDVVPLWEDWLRHAKLDDLLRTLERKSWQPWCMTRGYLGSRYRLDADRKAEIRRQAALLIFQQGGTYNAGGCIIRSDGSRIWTELA